MNEGAVLNQLEKRVTELEEKFNIISQARKHDNRGVSTSLIALFSLVCNLAGQHSFASELSRLAYDEKATDEEISDGLIAAANNFDAQFKRGPNDA